VRDFVAEPLKESFKVAKGLMFKFEKGVFLTNCSHLNIGSEMVDQEEMLLPEMIDFTNHEVFDHFREDSVEFLII